MSFLIKRKIGIDCPECFYAGKVKIHKIYFSDNFEVTDSRDMQNCPMCDGIGLISKIESLSLAKSLMIHIVNWINR